VHGLQCHHTLKDLGNRTPRAGSPGRRTSLRFYAKMAYLWGQYAEKWLENSPAWGNGNIFALIRRALPL
jgi:hypothetical protein